MTMYDIPFYPGYKLSEDFKIIGKKGHPLTYCEASGGHLYVNVYVEKERILYLHRAIALVHVPGYFDKAVVDHKNGNPQDNSPSNLRWVTPGENMMNRKYSVKELQKKIQKTEERISRLKSHLNFLKQQLFQNT